MHWKQHGNSANKSMPIIEPPGDSETLSQGDVLSGVNLFTTKGGWEGDSGKSAKFSQQLCLVLSRPCVVEHKPTIVVAAVDEYQSDVPKSGMDSFKKVKVFLENMRDGGRSRDTFYLGQLPEKSGRFCARLDAIFTIQVPPAPDQLPKLLKKRIGSLNPDFVRDLHIRLFASFASLGFHDQNWLSDDDLNWLVGAATSELANMDSTRSSHIAEGKDTSTMDSKMDSLKQELEPFSEEQKSRQGS